MAKIKIIYKDITEESTKIMFKWIRQELKIECENLEIRDYENNEKISVIDNYKYLFEHCEIILNKLVNLLDIDLFEAWDIYFSQENFVNVDNWEDWENVEHIEDLKLKVNKYDEIAEHMKKVLEDNNRTFIDTLK